MSSAFISSGMTYNYGQPRRVRKSKWGQLPWVVTNHPAGSMCFATWRDAMNYAYSGWYTMNLVDMFGIPPVFTFPAVVGP